MRLRKPAWCCAFVLVPCLACPASAKASHFGRNVTGVGRHPPASAERPDSRRGLAGLEGRSYLWGQTSGPGALTLSSWTLRAIGTSLKSTHLETNHYPRISGLDSSAAVASRPSNLGCQVRRAFLARSPDGCIGRQLITHSRRSMFATLYPKP